MNSNSIIIQINSIISTIEFRFLNLIQIWIWIELISNSIQFNFTKLNSRICIIKKMISLYLPFPILITSLFSSTHFYGHEKSKKWSTWFITLFTLRKTKLMCWWNFVKEGCFKILEQGRKFFGANKQGFLKNLKHSYDILGARMLSKPKEARILKNFIEF